MPVTTFAIKTVFSNDIYPAFIFSASPHHVTAKNSCDCCLLL